jgi:hypothetical protein
MTIEPTPTTEVQRTRTPWPTAGPTTTPTATPSHTPMATPTGDPSDDGGTIYMPFMLKSR